MLAVLSGVRKHLRIALWSYLNGKYRHIFIPPKFFICSDFLAQSLVIRKLKGAKVTFENFSRKKGPENSRWPFQGKKPVKNGKLYHFLEQASKKFYASANSSYAQRPPPPGWPPGISIFFALDGKFPGVGTLELSNPPGWGRKKRANAPSSVNTATFFIDRIVE